VNERLNPAYAFGTLIAGASNQLAIAAGKAIAEAARPPFNPLYVHAAPGQGKTHLLQAIGALRESVEPGSRIVHLAWSELEERLARAGSAGAAAEVLRPVEEADLLLLDDVDRFRDRTASRDALLSLLETRLTHRRATVLAGTASPAAIMGADDPAARVLGGGLVVELEAPDRPMREEMVRRLATAGGVSFNRRVVEEVVGLSLESASDLVSAVNRLIAFQRVSPAPLDPSQARVLVTGVLGDFSDEQKPSLEPGPAEAPEPAVPVDEPQGEGDEFGAFLSEIVAGVSEQVDRWRSRVGDAILRWEAEGFHTARLHALLDQELPAQPETVLQRYEADIASLRRIAEEVASLAPDLAEHEALHDPDQVGLAEQLLDHARVRELDAHRPHPDFRLDDFAEGSANHAALEAIRQMLAAPGESHNPLVLLGDSGSGKTHLLHAAGARLEEHGVLGVACLGAQALTGEYEEWRRGGRLAEWQRRFYWVGALLLDDLHLLAGHPGVQELLLEVVDRLVAAKRSVVCTTTVPLTELADCSPQLLARLAAGSLVELPRPDRDLRRAIARRALSGTSGEDAALIDYLASRPADSVRGVQGLVNRVLREAEAQGVAASLTLARNLFERSGARPSKAPARPGVLGPTVAGARLREKLIDVWPQPGDLLIEELP